MRDKKLIGYYDYTVVLTYLGMLFAFAGILMAMQEKYCLSMILLMAAGVCDMFDGAVASTKNRTKEEKHFGIQIDSLCDLISFGVLPGIFVYKICGETVIVAVIAGIFVLCGLIRLAYYNVQEFARQQVTEEKRDYFLGFPITTSALVLPLVFIIYTYFEPVGEALFPAALGLMAVGYIAGVKIKKPCIIGKIAILIVGLAEAVGVILLFCAGIV